MNDDDNNIGSLHYNYEGKLHREDGPAIEYKKINNIFNGGYYINGKEYTQEDYWKEIEYLQKLKELL